VNVVPAGWHTGVAPVHIVVQLPHVVAVERFASQPSLARWLQSKNGALQL
jgi:hypothetical protein